MDNPTLSPWIVFAPFFFYLMYIMMRGATCPDCRAWISGIVSPFAKTKRQWLEGGYVCPNCGCEVNMAGGKVPANMPVRWPFVAIIVSVTLLIIYCVGNYFLLRGE